MVEGLSCLKEMQAWVVARCLVSCRCMAMLWTAVVGGMVLMCAFITAAGPGFGGSQAPDVPVDREGKDGLHGIIQGVLLLQLVQFCALTLIGIKAC